ncbi:hypothetical protein PVAG01_08151 [Phlyctema vagabunda]|uniref:Uncharacterized protein n=1 Tax=Phlyctema vagabunda TaxID=108571 RepID=A0ABR4P8L5_9HELO
MEQVTRKPIPSTASYSPVSVSHLDVDFSDFEVLGQRPQDISRPVSGTVSTLSRSSRSSTNVIEMQQLEPNELHTDPRTGTDPAVSPEQNLNTGASGPFLTKPSEPSRAAAWGINWLHEPVQMILLFIAGVLLAVGHHLFYADLDGQAVSTATFSQSSVKQVGQAFVFLTLWCIKGSITEAYNQYIWTIFRRRFLALNVIDRLIALPTKASSFLSLRLFSDAYFAALLAVVAWCTFLAGLTPAATLSVQPKSQASTVDGSIPFPNYFDPNLSWWTGRFPIGSDSVTPSPRLQTIALETAFSSLVTPPATQYVNSSFEVHFYGPSVQCNDSSPAQNLAFRDLMDGFSSSGLYVKSTAEPDGGAQTFDGERMLVYSAFSPTIGDNNILSVGGPALLNNWDAPLLSLDDDGYSAQQLWILTADGNMVCSLVNASFTVGYNYTDGVGVVSHQSIKVLPAADGSNSTAIETGAIALTDRTRMPYFAAFAAFASNLFGNITLNNNGQNCPPDCGEGGLNGASISIDQATSHILATALAACPEISKNWWSQKYNFTSDFPNDASLCRNQTLRRAIEDLANNVTISTLSNPGLMSNTTATIAYSTIENVYEYDTQSLWISYGILIGAGVIAVVIGVLSLISNGVYHNASFSAILATTRNRDLDHAAEGMCLGETKGMGEERLMFGVLTPPVNQHRQEGTERGRSGEEEEGELKHIAFGLEESVIRLKKGEHYS